MSNLFLISFLFILSWKNPAEKEIRWSEKRDLQYVDFRGHVPQLTPWAATTISTINLDYTSDGAKLSDIKVYAGFDPEKSWIKNRLPEVLAHEQLHFDITEIYSRKLYLALNGNRHVHVDEVDALFQAMNDSCDLMQDAYDSETGHGVLEKPQRAWQKKIADLLETLAAYPRND